MPHVQHYDGPWPERQGWETEKQHAKRVKPYRHGDRNRATDRAGFRELFNKFVAGGLPAAEVKQVRDAALEAWSDGKDGRVPAVVESYVTGVML
jgi:hypothetical protein